MPGSCFYVYVWAHMHLMLAKSVYVFVWVLFFQTVIASYKRLMSKTFFFFFRLFIMKHSNGPLVVYLFDSTFSYL